MPKEFLIYNFDMKKFAEQTIRAAGEILRKKFRNVKNIRIKSSAADIVTEADFLSEELIINAIKKKLPNHEVLSEETLQRVNYKADYLWVIDPLDGTRNFAHGIPFFSITMSLKRKGRTVLGLVYDPWHDELFSAEKGKGAFLNNQRVFVKKTDKVDRAMISFDFTRRDKKVIKNLVGIYGNLLKKQCWISGFKSAALNLTYLAVGRFDASVLYNLALWDIDAGALIAREAGAKVEVVEAKTNDPYYKYRVLTANPVLFNKLKDKYIKLKF